MNKTTSAEAKDKAASERGMAAAQEALAASPKPIFIVDELRDSHEEVAWAMGWNSIWASEENQRRWDAERLSRSTARS